MFVLFIIPGEEEQKPGATWSIRKSSNCAKACGNVARPGTLEGLITEKAFSQQRCEGQDTHGRNCYDPISLGTSAALMRWGHIPEIEGEMR